MTCCLDSFVHIGNKKITERCQTFILRSPVSRGDWDGYRPLLSNTVEVWFITIAISPCLLLCCVHHKFFINF